MADIELVIKIPEETYKHIMSMQFYIPEVRTGKSLLEKILKAIRTGTPLPKGHGNLIDIKDLYEHLNKERDDNFVLKADAIVSKIKPIIEADKESEEK